MDLGQCAFSQQPKQIDPKITGSNLISKVQTNKQANAKKKLIFDLKITDFQTRIKEPNKE